MEKINLREAQALWKGLPPIEKKFNGWTATEIFTRNILLQHFTETQLNQKEGFNWEDSFKSGFSIESAASRQNASGTCLFREENQAYAALAFAQLTHIVAKYNEDKKKGAGDYFVVKTFNGLDVHDDDSGLYPEWMRFNHMADAKMSMEVNRDLWEKYWLIKDI